MFIKRDERRKKAIVRPILLAHSPEKRQPDHQSILSYFGLSTGVDDCNLPYMHWIPKLHENPYKQHCIAGSGNCTTKPLSKLFTSILTAVKDGLKSYHYPCYSRSSINSMWILNNSKDLLETLNSRLLSGYNIIQTYDFSTVYTSTPLTQCKFRLKNIIHHCYYKKNSAARYVHLQIYSTSQRFFILIKMIPNHLQRYRRRFFQNGGIFLSTTSLSSVVDAFFKKRSALGTNCAPLLIDLLFHKADFIAGLIQRKEHRLDRSLISVSATQMMYYRQTILVSGILYFASNPKNLR